MEWGEEMTQYEVCPENKDKLYFSYYFYPQVPWDIIHTHTHSTYEMIYVLDGDMTYVIEDRKYRIQKDDLIIVKPNDYHYLQFHSKQSYERYSVLFDPAVLSVSGIDLLLPDQEVINCRHLPAIGDLFKKIDYYREKFPEEILHDLLYIMLKELIYNLSIAGNQSYEQRVRSVHPLICRVLEEINKDIFAFVGIGQIAEQLYVSEGYLYHLFKREMKVSPGRYVMEKRLLAARNLLLQGKNPTKIYDQCGFSDYSTFFRSFNKFFGYPPSREGQKRIQ